MFRAACAELYSDRPQDYAADVLGCELTPDQESILSALRRPPYRVAAPSGTNLGKSFVAGVAASWWHDTFADSLVLTTGPTLSVVRDATWKELRRLRESAGLGGFPGPESLRLKAPGRLAYGLVSRDPTAFQGRHSRNVLVIFDEATGIASEFWDRTLPMLQGDNYAFLAIGNPTCVSSRFYQECETSDWNVLPLSALQHPNIARELRGEEPLFPSAVRLRTLQEMLEKWCRPVDGTIEPGDIEFPPGSGRWLRPGMEAEALLLGRWPSTSTSSVWGPGAWAQTQAVMDLEGPLELGEDVAGPGQDHTCVVARKGPTVLERVKKHGLDMNQVADLAIDVVNYWAPRFEDPDAEVKEGEERPKYDPKNVPIKIDGGGLGLGPCDIGKKAGYRFIPIVASGSPRDKRQYLNRRSEDWFHLSEEAARGRVSFARLSSQEKAELKRQLLSVTYGLDESGHRVVERKIITRQRLGYSPDDADATILAYAPFPEFVVRRSKGAA